MHEFLVVLKPPALCRILQTPSEQRKLLGIPDDGGAVKPVSEFRRAKEFQQEADAFVVEPPFR